MSGADEDTAGRRERERALGAYAAYNEVLAWLNTLDDKAVPKKEVYNAVMTMRPGSLAVVGHALNTAFIAMKLASALPAVSDEYDFTEAIADVMKAQMAIHIVPEIRNPIQG